MEELIDMAVSYAVTHAARIMNRSHAGLRKAAEGDTKPLIDLLRSDRPLNRYERDSLALLIGGELGRGEKQKRGNRARPAAREVAEIIVARKKANKVAGRRESVAAITAAVVEAWNSNPKRRGVKISVDQVVAFRRNSKSRK